MEKVNKYKEALKLSGKLANQVQLLLGCNMSDIDIALDNLQKSLDEYNNYIINWESNE